MVEIDLKKKLPLACFSATFTENINKRLFGEIFTIVEVAVSDLESRKSVKSLISQAFTRASNRIMSELNRLPESVEEAQKKSS